MTAIRDVDKKAMSGSGPLLSEKEKEALISDLLRCGAVKFGDFVLTSGKRSTYYVDIKQASTDPAVLKKIAFYMARFIRKQFGEARKSVEHIAGMELGAVPLATAVSLETGIHMLIIRKRKKEYGVGERVIGSFRGGENVVVVEDVVTTGGSSLDAVRVLRESGLDVLVVICVVDREEGGPEALQKEGVPLFSLVTAGDLLSHSDVSSGS